MTAILLAATGLCFVVAPQLMTLRYQYLKHKILTRYPKGTELTADMAYEDTTDITYINNRWNNLGLQTLKRYSVVIGYLIMLSAIGLGLTVSYHPTTVLDIALGGMLWMILERFSLNVCFRYFRLKDYALVLVAIFAPFILFFLFIIALYGITFIYPLKGEYFDLGEILHSTLNIFQA